VNLDDVFEAALSIHTALAQRAVPHMFIGGIAIQAWAEPRVTNDVDLLPGLLELIEEPERFDRLIAERDQIAAEFG